MKQNKGPLIILTVITIFIFKNNLVIQDAILKSCTLFLTKLFPSLFPMMIISDLFIYFGLPELLCKYFGKPFQKIFSTSPYGVFIFFISCFSGSPTNAYLIKNLTNKNYITEDEASNLLSFSFFSNPLFLYTMLSFIFKNDLKIVFTLLFLPYLVNILIGLFSKKSIISSNSLTYQKEKENFGIILSSSIKNAMNTLLLILGSVTIFFLLNALLNPINNPLLSGFLEISQGLNTLITINISQKAKEILSIAMISFGGLSIHLQIKGILSDTNISYQKFLKARIIQTVISVLIITLI